MTAVVLKEDCSVRYFVGNSEVFDGWDKGTVILVDKYNMKWLLDNMKKWRFATKEEVADSVWGYTQHNVTNLVQLLKEAGLLYEWLQLEPGDRFESDEILEKAVDIAYKEGF